jgi:hypothetical protein
LLNFLFYLQSIRINLQQMKLQNAVFRVVILGKPLHAISYVIARRRSLSRSVNSLHTVGRTGVVKYAVIGRDR